MGESLLWCLQQVRVRQGEFSELDRLSILEVFEAELFSSTSSQGFRVVLQWPRVFDKRGVGTTGSGV